METQGFSSKAVGHKVHPLIEKIANEAPSKSIYHLECAEIDVVSKKFYAFEETNNTKITARDQARKIVGGGQIQFRNIDSASSTNACPTCEYVLQELDIKQIE